MPHHYLFHTDSGLPLGSDLGNFSAQGKAITKTLNFIF